MRDLIDLLEDINLQQRKRIEFARSQLLNKYTADMITHYGNFDEFVEKIAEFDPTPSGIYIPWIARIIIKSNNLNVYEDLEKIKNDLKLFELHKNKLVNKDINSYKSFEELYDAIKQFYKPVKLSAYEKKLASIRDEIELVYEGPEGWIRIPKTKRASQYLGQNTRWCTAAKSMCAFDDYAARDKLIVIYDKKSRDRMQFHVDSGQLADVQDKIINLNELPEWTRIHIQNLYPVSSSLKQAITLASANINTQSEHQKLLDLMKEYEVL
jgi:hypothetical protein